MVKMRKEVAIGLSVISVLLIIFGLLLYRRLMPGGQTPDRDVAQAAGQSPLPISQKAAKSLVVEARDAADDRTGAAAQGWAPSYPDLAEPPAAYAGELPPRESASASEVQDLENAAAAHVLTPSEDPNLLAQWGAPPVEAGFEPQQRPLAALGNAADEIAAGDPAAGLRERRQQLAESAADAQEASDDSLAMRDTVRGQRDDDQPREAIPTSGTLPADGESPHAGFRSRFPQRAEDQQPQYDASDRQPAHLGHLEREAAGEYSDRQPGHATVENGRYAVQPNDNYWTIAEKVYGNGGYFKALYEHNRLRYPRSDKLQVGDVLDTPHATVLQERYAELCPKLRKVPSTRNTLVPASTRHRVGERVYVVGEGDTLFDIAKYELGKASRWTEIYALNHDVLGEDFDYLRPGTELVLPQDRREAESVTRGRDPSLQR